MFRIICIIAISIFCVAAYATSCPPASDFLNETSRGWELKESYKAQGWVLERPLDQNVNNPHKYVLDVVEIIGDVSPPYWEASCQYRNSRNDYPNEHLVNTHLFKLDISKLKGFDTPTDIAICYPENNASACEW